MDGIFVREGSKFQWAESKTRFIALDKNTQTVQESH